MEVLFYEPEHADMYVEFARRVWDPTATREGLLAARLEHSRANPYADNEEYPPVVLAVQDGQIIGHLTAVPARMWVRDREVPMHWASDIYVLPEGRGKGVAKALVKALSERYRFLTGVLVVEPSRRAHVRQGWHFDYRLPEYIKVLNPRGFAGNLSRGRFPFDSRWFSRVASACVNSRLFRIFMVAGLSGYSGLVKLSGKGGRFCSRIREVDAFDHRVDGLWMRNRQRLVMAQVRTSSYLNFSFPTERGWQKFVYQADNLVLAYAVVHTKQFVRDARLAEMRVTSITDIFWDLDRRDVLTELLDHLVAVAERASADAVVMSVNHRTARRLCLTRGFLRMPSTVYYGYHCTDEALQVPLSLRHWFITRGDADAAGSLGPV